MNLIDLLRVVASSRTRINAMAMTFDGVYSYLDDNLPVALEHDAEFMHYDQAALANNIASNLKRVAELMDSMVEALNEEQKLESTSH